MRKGREDPTRYDEEGALHRADGPLRIFKRAEVTGRAQFIKVLAWRWHGEKFRPDNFDESWPDDKKAWWMRARMESK